MYILEGDKKGCKAWLGSVTAEKRRILNMICGRCRKIELGKVLWREMQEM